MPSIGQKILAWSVHVFTALGAVAAFMAILAIDNQEWSLCFLWLFVGLLIDGIDGSLARLFNVKEVLPHVDGKGIDFVIDFVTYILVPVYFFYKAELTSDSLLLPAIFLMLVSSALYYGLSEMTDNDEYFIGFPALWNVVVYFQFFILHTGELLNFGMVVIFAFLHFIPLRFAYPSRAKRFFWLHLIVAFVGLSAGLYVLLQYPHRLVTFEWIALLGAIYFGIMALFETKTRNSED